MSGAPPEKARLDAAGAIKVNSRETRILLSTEGKISNSEFLAFWRGLNEEKAAAESHRGHDHRRAKLGRKASLIEWVAERVKGVHAAPEVDRSFSSRPGSAWATGKLLAAVMQGCRILSDQERRAIYEVGAPGAVAGAPDEGKTNLEFCVKTAWERKRVPMILDVEQFCGNAIPEKQKRELLKIYLTKLRETLARAPPTRPLSLAPRTASTKCNHVYFVWRITDETMARTPPTPRPCTAHSEGRMLNLPLGRAIHARRIRCPPKPRNGQ